MAQRSGMLAAVEYAGIRLGMGVLQSLPMESTLQAARVLSRGWARVLPRHRERAIDHLRTSFPDATLSWIEDVADRCLAHWTMFAVEFALGPKLITPYTWGRYISLVNLHEFLRLLLSGKGLILVTGHYGNFELIGHLLACLGFDVAAIMRAMDNDYFNRFIVRTRAAHGLKLLDKRGATASAEQLLSDGTLLAFIADQNAGHKGLFVDFFSRPASTYKSIGLLAMQAKAPIVVGYARRCGSGFHYEVGIERIIHPHEWEQREDPLWWITQEYTAAIESFVRTAPEQYLWFHRRWKTQPRKKKTSEERAIPLADSSVASL